MGYSVEDSLTIACVRWFRLQYPREVIYHVPNERNTKRKLAGDRWVTTGEGAKLKKMGVKKGVSDLVIPAPSACYNGFYIELKSERWKNGKKVRGYPSKDQLEFLAAMHDYGYAVAVCWNVDDFMRYVSRYMDHAEIECDYLVRNNHIKTETP